MVKVNVQTYNVFTKSNLGIICGKKLQCKINISVPSIKGSRIPWSILVLYVSASLLKLSAEVVKSSM